MRFGLGLFHKKHFRDFPSNEERRTRAQNCRAPLAPATPTTIIKSNLTSWPLLTEPDMAPTNELKADVSKLYFFAVTKN